MRHHPATWWLLCALAAACGIVSLSGSTFDVVLVGASAEVPGYEHEGRGILAVAGWGGPDAGYRVCPDGVFFCATQVGPDFALYDDGHVIFRGGGPDRTDMLEARISPARALALVRELMDAGFGRLPHLDEVRSASDEAGASILLRDGLARGDGLRDHA